MNPCECPGPGFCNRYQRRMNIRQWELCSGKCPPERPCREADSEGLRRLWLGERGQEIYNPAAVAVHVPEVIEFGPGTELKKLLVELGAEACAGCLGFVFLMNQWGVQGCRDHRGEI